MNFTLCHSIMGIRNIFFIMSISRNWAHIKLRRLKPSGYWNRFSWGDSVGVSTRGAVWSFRSDFHTSVCINIAKEKVEVVSHKACLAIILSNRSFYLHEITNNVMLQYLELQEYSFSVALVH